MPKNDEHRPSRPTASSTSSTSETATHRLPASPPRPLSKRQKRFLNELPRLGYRSYHEYLRSDHWKGLKARYRASGSFQKCTVCFDPNVDLHHKTYKRLGQEKLTDLVPLCRLHHDTLHAQNLGLWTGPKQLREKARSSSVRRKPDEEPRD
jgi:hypothetical protein